MNNKEKVNTLEEILKLENVSLSYDNKKTYVLKDISFGVLSGEILSIIGMNGSGKSTLLKVIAGIQKIDSGKIIKNYKKLSYVPQKISLDKTFPILVSEFIKIYNPKTTKENIISYLKKFNSENLFEKNIASLSGGEFQKVLIISALLNKPDLILLDEPTAGIDIIGEEIFYEIIKEVKVIFPKISIILVSHNIKLVYKNSDKVICLHENNFCCHGSPLEVSANKITESIFGKYTLPYKHNPHDKTNHNK
ncbi:metal ABC transporter ATP-binding protein [Candidatus Gracilibacteria bacterium]|nr:metal ABC transporter ATP-binding protein [Candidatus Gracilibacteria bacterium]